jgi:peptidoglycan/xylan/chitin deacetylase (PgdA/CDA1 family)
MAGAIVTGPGERVTVRVPILLYHSVSDTPSSFISPYAVTPATFARHLDVIAESGAATLTVSDLRSALASGTALPQRPVLVTFDDGYLDTLTTAAPLLAERAMAMTAYVISGAVGGVSPGGDPMMSWSQVGELAGSGAEIGGHSHTHPELDTVPAHRVRDEVAVCKDRLEQQTGQQVRSFAYPHGYSSPRTRRVVEQAGYSSACSVKNALSSPFDPPYAISRLMVMATTSDETIRGWVGGNGAPVGQDEERLLTRGWRAWRRIGVRWGRTPHWAHAC